MSTMPTVETMDEVGGTVRSAIDGLRDRAVVSSVYGDPVEVEGKTIIPVARIAYGFGGGFGSGTERAGEEGEDEAGDEETEHRVGTGGGGGGGAAAAPIGVVEVSATGTRFVRFGGRTRLGLALLAGLALGFLLGRR